METQEVLDFFGGVSATARALGITHGAVSQWGERVPRNRVVHVTAVMELERQAREAGTKRNRVSARNHRKEIMP